MKSLLPLLLAASLLAAEPPADDLGRLDARELHNRGTRRLADGDLAGAEEALRASLGRDIDALCQRLASQVSIQSLGGFVQPTLSVR